MHASARLRETEAVLRRHLRLEWRGHDNADIHPRSITAAAQAILDAFAPSRADPISAGGVELALDLSELSARAAPGLWEVRPCLPCWGTGYVRIVAGHLTVAEDIDGDEAAFVVALANAYRSRALVIPGPATVEAARPLSEWHEEIGDVLWWRFPIEEPPYCGSPLDVGRTIRMTVESFGAEPTVSHAQVGGWPGYHTHWTPLRLPPEPRPAPQPHDPTASQGEGIPTSSP